MIGAEFATPSVSSPGFEAIFGTDPATLQGFEQTNALLVDDLEYVNASKRGFVLATFSRTEVKAEWNYVSTITTKNTSLATEKTVTVL
jgi:alkaline phosphatase D